MCEHRHGNSSTIFYFLGHFCITLFIYFRTGAKYTPDTVLADLSHQRRSARPLLHHAVLWGASRLLSITRKAASAPRQLCSWCIAVSN